MPSVIVKFMCVWAAQALTKEPKVNFAGAAQNVTERIADKVTNTLVDGLLDRAFTASISPQSNLRYSGELLAARWVAVSCWLGSSRLRPLRPCAQACQAKKTAATPLPLAVKANEQLSDLDEYGCDRDGCEVEIANVKDRGAQQILEDPTGEFTSVEVEDVRRFTARPSGFVISVLEISVEGALQNRTITRGEILETTKLRPRDLRAVVTRPLPGSDTAGQVIIRRPAAVVLSIGSTRAIIEPARALLFSTDSSSTPRFLRLLKNRRKGDLQGSLVLAFTESALLTLGRRLEARAAEIRSTIEPLLLGSPRGIVGMSTLLTKTLEQLRQQRRRLLRYASEAEAASQAVQRCLDSDERDFAAGQLPSEFQIEWSEMLEGNFELFKGLAREFRRLLDEIEGYDDNAALALQERRLLVEEFELSLIILSISIGAGALLTGALGMNLLNRFETSLFAFPVAILATLGVGISVYAVLRGQAAKEGLIPEDYRQE